MPKPPFFFSLHLFGCCLKAMIIIMMMMMIIMIVIITTIMKIMRIIFKSAQ